MPSGLSSMPSWNNHDAIHRHACHAYEDFRALRKLLQPYCIAESSEVELWHSISHHLRHVVFRSGNEVDEPRREVRRAHVDRSHG
jgi:hypothetical protein